jgi:hypothetical protein
MEPQAIDLRAKLATFEGHWQPRTVCEYNGHDVMVVKVQGEYRLPALLAEIASVLQWAFGMLGASGAEEDESEWGYKLQGVAELNTPLSEVYDEDSGVVTLTPDSGQAWTTWTLTLSGSPAFCVAFREIRASRLNGSPNGRRYIASLRHSALRSCRSCYAGAIPAEYSSSLQLGGGHSLSMSDLHHDIALSMAQFVCSSERLGIGSPPGPCPN